MDDSQNSADARPILRIEGLTTEFSTESAPVRAVNGVTLDVQAGETLGIVGESGSGKSVTMTSVLGLLPRNGRVTAGSAWFGGRDLLQMPEKELQRIRGKEIGMIFQDPMTALNPVMTIGSQISESLRRHTPELDRRGRRARVIELLSQVRIPRAAARVNQYPHEFSGGMRQRAMIAMAMANRPRLLLADEPTTALDVTVQAQILELLAEVQAETGSALVMITHDLGVIAEVADRAVVMYAGRVVESGTIDQIFHEPRHPYTRGLLQSRPSVDDTRSHDLPAIPGQPPNPALLPAGCDFRPRCDQSHDRKECLTAPPLFELGGGHCSACHFHRELALAGAPVEAQ